MMLSNKPVGAMRLLIILEHAVNEGWFREKLENQNVAQVIRQTATMEEAAKVLSIDPATLYRKRKKLCL